MSCLFERVRGNPVPSRAGRIARTAHHSLLLRFRRQKHTAAAMQRLQAFRFELMPRGEQARKMRQLAGACRVVYNKALALQKETHEAGGKFIGKFAIAKHLTDWRNSPETPWLADSPRHALMMATQACDRAFQNFFAKRADFPRSKRKGTGDGFTYPDKKRIRLDRENGRVFLPKLGTSVSARAATCSEKSAVQPCRFAAASGSRRS